MHAKTMSKVFKVISTLFAVVMSLLKWQGIFSNVSIAEIIYISCFIYGAGAGTIDLNIMLDKFSPHKKAEV